MENRKAELNGELVGMRKQAINMAARTPPPVAEKLQYNATLDPSKRDFNSNFESDCKLDGNYPSAWPDAAKLIEDMRLVRQQIHNLEFAEEQQRGPTNTMTC
jgi:hypothetical protein